MEQNQLEIMDRKAEMAITNWSSGAIAANILPPSLDIKAGGRIFAMMGEQLAKIYQVQEDAEALRGMGAKMAKDVGAENVSDNLPRMLKYIPGINVWVGLIIQPSIMAAIAASVGSAFKKYFRTLKLEKRKLTQDEVAWHAKEELKRRLSNLNLSGLS